MDSDEGRLFRRIPSKIVKVGSIPNKVGSMRIEFHAPTNGKVPTPSIDTETMTAILPMDESLMYHTLEAGNSFLFTWKLFERTEAWYGGVACSLPFLVRLRREIMDVFTSAGEEAFLQALMPKWVSQMRLASFGGPATRVGPIVAYPFNLSWEEIDLLAQIIGGRKLVNDERAAFKIANTFYRIKGCCRQYNGTAINNEEVRIADGVIEGPIRETKSPGITIASPSKKFQYSLRSPHAVMLINGMA